MKKLSIFSKVTLLVNAQPRFECRKFNSKVHAHCHYISPLNVSTLLCDSHSLLHAKRIYIKAQSSMQGFGKCLVNVCFLKLTQLYLLLFYCSFYLKIFPGSLTKTQSALFNETQYFIASMCHYMFNQYSIHGHSPCFQLVLTTNNPAVNSLYVNLYGPMLLFLWARFPRAGLLITGYPYLCI